MQHGDSHGPARGPVGPVLAALAVAAVLGGGCVTQDDARVQTLLNQRGFGAPYVGDANEQYYVGIGDSILVLDPGFPELNNSYQVRTDGVIDVAWIGEIFIAGLTIQDVGEVLNRRYRDFIAGAQVDVQLGASVSKVFYVDGQVDIRGPIPFQGGHMLFDVVFRAHPTILADEDDVRLIRADPVNPLVVSFDYDDMAAGGYSRGNVVVRENDIIYVPPNILGYIALGLRALLAPLNEVVASMLNVSRLIYLGETFGDDERYYGGRGGRGGRGRFGGVGFGGLYGGAGEEPKAPAAPTAAGNGSNREVER